MHYLPNKKLRHSNVHSYGPNWFVGIIINHGIDISDKFGASARYEDDDDDDDIFIRTIKVSF